MYGLAGGAPRRTPPSARPRRRGRKREALCTWPPGLREPDGYGCGLCGLGAESGPEPEPQWEARGLCAEMAAAPAAAAEEGMEPRALQYEQTLVSEAEPSSEVYAPELLLRVTLGSARTGGLSKPHPSLLSWGN